MIRLFAAKDGKTEHEEIRLFDDDSEEIRKGDPVSSYYLKMAIKLLMPLGILMKSKQRDISRWATWSGMEHALKVGFLSQENTTQKAYMT